MFVVDELDGEVAGREMVGRPIGSDPERRAIPIANRAPAPTKLICDKPRRFLVRYLESAAVQVAILLLIAFDFSLTVFQIAEDVTDPSGPMYP